MRILTVATSRKAGLMVKEQDNPTASHNYKCMYNNVKGNSQSTNNTGKLLCLCYISVKESNNLRISYLFNPLTSSLQTADVPGDLKTFAVCPDDT